MTTQNKNELQLHLCKGQTFHSKLYFSPVGINKWLQKSEMVEINKQL